MDWPKKPFFRVAMSKGLTQTKNQKETVAHMLSNPQMVSAQLHKEIKQLLHPSDNVVADATVFGKWLV